VIAEERAEIHQTAGRDATSSIDESAKSVRGGSIALFDFYCII